MTPTRAARAVRPRLALWTATVRAIGVAGMLVFAGQRAGAAKTAAPDWVMEAVRARVPEDCRTARAVVLLDERELSIQPDGRRIDRRRGAIRIQASDAHAAALAGMVYVVGGSKIQSATGWLVRPDGSVREFARKEFFDVALSPEQLYSEVRRLALPASAEPMPGSVLAWEFAVSEVSVFPDEQADFGVNYPTLVQRWTVRLPKGWGIDARMFNHAAIEPKRNGADTTWELRDSRPLADEPWSPSPAAMNPILACTLLPPAGGKSPLRRSGSWSDVSTFVSELTEPSVVVDASVKAKAEELTRGITDEMEKLATLARFAQRLTYVAISMRLNTGGGMKPHPAPQVLKCNYGDCKDKASLLRALLRAVGIDSYHVAVAADEGAVVRPEWPSSVQFNHAIVAIRVSPAVQSDIIIEDPVLGRLLLFDPTASYTAFGDLPGAYQGSLALVLAGPEGHLVTVPERPGSANSYARTVRATISPYGAIDATVTEVSRGQAAALERGIFHSGSMSDYQKVTTSWAAGTVRGARVEELQPVDRFASGQFDLSFKVHADAYGQVMRGKLLVFKPVILSRRSFTPLTSATRTLPICLRARSVSEQTEIELPEGHALSEIGRPVELHEDFGDYTLTIAVEGRVVRLNRSLELRAATIPAEDYARVREFFLAMIRAEQQPVVLERLPAPGG